MHARARTLTHIHLALSLTLSIALSPTVMLTSAHLTQARNPTLTRIVIGLIRTLTLTQTLYNPNLIPNSDPNHPDADPNLDPGPCSYPDPDSSFVRAVAFFMARTPHDEDGDEALFLSPSP